MLRNVLVCMSGCLLLIAAGCAALSGENAGAAKGGGQAVIDLGNGVLQDTTTGLMWQAEKSPLFSDLEEARKYVAELRLGGFNDWRLPTIYELYEFNFTFDFKKTTKVNVDRKGSYWSAKEEGGGDVGAWEVEDQCELERSYVKYTKGYVRAVRL